MELSGDSAVIAASTDQHLSCQDAESGLLLRSIAQGDRSAFWKLWGQHQAHLLSVCFREMGGNRADAEDALSVAMLRALDRLPFHADAILNARAWLTRLTSNLCKEIHRARSRQSNLAASVGGQWVADELATQFIQTPEDSFLQHEIIDCLKEAIRRLPLQLRDPLLLRLRDELPSGEIADRLELSSDNVRKRIQVARSMLKGSLEEYLAGRASVSKQKQRYRPSPARSFSPALTDKNRSWQFQSANDETVYFKSVSVILTAGIELDYCLVLDRKPTRERTRIRTLRKYSERHPNGWKKALEMAYLLYTTGKWDESIALYRYVLEKRPQLLNVRLQLGNILHIAMRRDEAIDVYEQALVHHTKVPARHVLEGMIQSCCGDYQRAAKEFEAASRLDPFLPRLRYLWGRACQKAGIFDRMLDVFDRILEFDPGNLIANIYRHDALLALDRYQDATRQIEYVCKIHPNSIPALQRLAAHLCREGLVKGAEGRKTLFFVRKLIKLAPDGPTSRELLSLFYFLRGEIDRSPEPLAEYTKDHPNNPFGWFLLSKWLHKIGRTATGEYALSTAMRLYSSCGQSPGGPSRACPAPGLTLQKEMAECFQDRHLVLLP